MKKTKKKLRKVSRQVIDILSNLNLDLFDIVMFFILSIYIFYKLKIIIGFLILICSLVFVVFF